MVRTPRWCPLRATPSSCDLLTATRHLFTRSRTTSREREKSRDTPSLQPTPGPFASRRDKTWRSPGMAWLSRSSTWACVRCPVQSSAKSRSLLDAAHGGFSAATCASLKTTLSSYVHGIPKASLRNSAWNFLVEMYSLKKSSCDHCVCKTLERTLSSFSCRHFFHKVCMEHSFRNVFSKWFKLCSLPFQEFQKHLHLYLLSSLLSWTVHETRSSKRIHWRIQVVLTAIPGLAKELHRHLLSLLLSRTVHGTLSSKHLHWRIQVVLITIAGFHKNFIVISCPHFCHELCMEHSRQNVFIEGFKLCSLPLRDSIRTSWSSLVLTSVMNCTWNTVIKKFSLKGSSCAHCHCGIP